MNFLKYFTVYMLVSLLSVGTLYYLSGGRGLAFGVLALAILFVVGLVLAIGVSKIHKKNSRIAVIVSASYLLLVVSFFVIFYISNAVVPACAQQAREAFKVTGDIQRYDRWCVSERDDNFYIQMAEERYDEALFNALLEKGTRHKSVDCARFKFAVFKGELARIQKLMAEGVRANCQSSAAGPLDVLQSQTVKDSLTDDIRVQIFDQLLADASSIASIKANIKDSLFIPAMIKFGINVTLADINNAVRKGRHDVLAVLVKLVNVNTGEQILPNQFTHQQISNPLLLAVTLADEKSVQILMDAGAKPDQKVQIQNTTNKKYSEPVRDIYTYALYLQRVTQKKANNPRIWLNERQQFITLASQYQNIVEHLGKMHGVYPSQLAVDEAGRINAMSKVIDWSKPPYTRFKYIHELDNGSLLAVGELDTHFQTEKIALYKLNKDFSLDQDFQKNIESAPVKAYFKKKNYDLFFINLTQVTTDPQGKIYLLGAFGTSIKYKNGEAKPSFSMLRFHPDGTLDETFQFNNFPGFIKIIKKRDTGFFAALESGRMLYIDYATNAISDLLAANRLLQADQVAFQADGKLVVAGLAGVFRINADGTEDTLFNNNTSGKFFPDGCAERSCEVTGLKVRKDGKIILTTNEDFVDTRGIVCLKPDGTFDQPFMNNLKNLKHGGLHSFGVMLRENNKVLIQSYQYPLRINEDGSEDFEFNEKVSQQTRLLKIELSNRSKRFEFDNWVFYIPHFLLGPEGDIVQLRK